MPPRRNQTNTVSVRRPTPSIKADVPHTGFQRLRIIGALWPGLRCRHPDYQSCPHFQAMVLARLDGVDLAEALDHP